LHITTDAAPDDRPDAYVDGLVRDVRSRFGTRVPMLVSRVQPTGRARTDAPSDRPPVSTPCQFAGWPLVDHDGTVYACTRQSLLRTVRPAHLVLGHASRDAWTTLRDRTLGDPLLRSVRMFGPLATRDRFDAPGPGCGSDGCTACVALSDGEAARTAASDYLDSESGGRVERAVLQLSAARPPRRLAAARGAVGRYAELTELGWKSA
jgi:hypothetical protein